MIDVEPQIFTAVSDALTTEFPEISVSGRTIFQPTSFPFVCFEEADSSILISGIDSSRDEKFSEIMYEVNVYSNKAAGAKAECKKIFKVIDDTMRSLNATRLGRQPIDMDDASKYRLAGRYRLIVGNDEKLYRS